MHQESALAIRRNPFIANGIAAPVSAGAQTALPAALIMVVMIDGGGHVMRAMDEFGSVLTMAALILGICAAADWFFLAAADDGARSEQADAERSTPRFMVVVHRDRVVVADRNQPRQVAAAPGADSDGGAQVAAAAPIPFAQQNPVVMTMHRVSTVCDSVQTRHQFRPKIAAIIKTPHKAGTDATLLWIGKKS